MNVAKLVALVLFACSFLPAQNNPWVQEFAPKRVFHVAPNGTGTGSADSPLSLVAAMDQARPGDLYWLHRGVYSGVWVFERNGTRNSPIVWRAYTLQGEPERATIRGKIRTEGKWNWFWGLEVTDPLEITRSPGVEFFAEGSRVINCVIHNIANNNGIGAWSTGSGQAVYGTVIYSVGMPIDDGPGSPPHPIYTQNDFASHGYKYFVQIMALDADSKVNSFNFHAFSETGSVSGIWVQDSFFDRGRFVVGHDTAASHHNVIRNSYFHDMTGSPASISLGWKGPSELQFSDNYIVGGTIVSRRHWGAGEDTFPQPKANEVTRNEIYRPFEGEHVRLTTAAFIGGLKVGAPKIRDEDEWDNNVYGSSAFRGSLHAGSQELEGLTLAQWRAFTQAQRESRLAAFDANSVLADEPTEAKVILLANEYERGRGHLGIFNWGNEATIPVDLSPVVSTGSTYKVRKARDFYGEPAASGTYAGGTVNVPTGGDFHTLFVVTSGTEPNVVSQGVVNAASYAAGVVPGSLATIFGQGLSEGITGTAFPAGATSFGGTEIRFGGHAAPLVAVSDTANGEQISVQVPFELVSGGQTTLEITVNDASETVTGVPVFREQPGVFEILGATVGTSFAAALHLDGTLVAPTSRAQRNEVISVYFTGGGTLQPQQKTGQPGPTAAPTLAAPFTVLIADRAAEVLFVGYAPGSLGLYQANIRIPSDTPSGPYQPLAIRVAQRLSQTSTIAIE